VILLRPRSDRQLVARRWRQVAGVDMLDEILRRRQDLTGIQHRLDVVEDHGDVLVAVQVLKPDRLAEEEEQDIVPDSTGAEAAGKAEMDLVANLAALPLLAIECGVDRGAALLGPAATAVPVRLRADEQVAV